MAPTNIANKSQISNDRQGAKAALAHLDQWWEESAKGGVSERHVSEQVGIRIAEAKRMQSEGIDPWPEARPFTTRCAEVDTIQANTKISVSGRVVSRRRFGGVGFLELQDFDGRCQAVVEERNCPNAAELMRQIDLADIV